MWQKFKAGSEMRSLSFPDKSKIMLSTSEELKEQTRKHHLKGPKSIKHI